MENDELTPPPGESEIPAPEAERDETAAATVDAEEAETDECDESGDAEVGDDASITDSDADSEDAPDASAPVDSGEAEEDGGEGEESAAEAEGEGGEPGESGDAEESEAGDTPALPLASVVEAVLFAAREALKVAQIARAVGKGTRQDAVRAAMEELNLHYLETGRAFEIAEIAGRFQLMSRPEYAAHIRRIYPRSEAGDKEKAKPSGLTPPAKETLAIIAYKQPVTRAEIERIRGVGSGPVLRWLIERGIVKVAGKKADVVGQPLLYGTTEAFLAMHGLGSLDELPNRSEFLNLFSVAMPMPEPDREVDAEPVAEAESGVAEVEAEADGAEETETESMAAVVEVEEAQESE